MSQHRLLSRNSTILSAEICECGGSGRVIESRSVAHGKRRRRECLRCKERWTTYEMRMDPGVNGLELPVAQLARLLRWLRAGLGMLESVISRLEILMPTLPQPETRDAPDTDQS